MGALDISWLEREQVSNLFGDTLLLRKSVCVSDVCVYCVVMCACVCESVMCVHVVEAAHTKQLDRSILGLMSEQSSLDRSILGLMSDQSSLDRSILGLMLDQSSLDRSNLGLMSDQSSLD